MDDAESSSAPTEPASKGEHVARIDDYKESFRLAALELKTADLHRHAESAGVELDLLGDGTVQLRLAFLGEAFVVRVAATVEVAKEGVNNDVPLPEQILLSHYLLRATGEAPSGKLITFREIRDGHFYYDAFQRRARDPFLATFGQQPELFRACGQHLGGQVVNHADSAMSFQVLPRIAIQLSLWTGDDEFPPEATILFDQNIAGYLPAEDIAVVSGMLVYRLMAIARGYAGKIGA
jgi:hypothetical protein